MPLSQLLRQSWDRLSKAAREQPKAVPVVGSVSSRVEAAMAHPPPLWSAHGHFHAPIPGAQDVGGHAAPIFDRGLTELPGIRLNALAQRNRLGTLAPYLKDRPLEVGPHPGVFSSAAILDTGSVSRGNRRRSLLEPNPLAPWTPVAAQGCGVTP